MEQRQREIDDREREKHEKDMELLQAQIEFTKEQTAHVGDAPTGSTGSTGSTSSKGKVLTTGSTGEGYTKLEQKKHERSRGTAARREGLQKREGKKI
jgi:hypothetical protein